MSDDDFLKAMGGVKPLQQEKRVALKKESVSSDMAKVRRKAAQAEMLQEKNELSGEEQIELLDPHALLEYQRPGVQNGVYRNLRLGKYAIDARLDLHHHTVDQARTALRAFVRDCVQHDIRCALITHGKGEGRKQPALLKSCVAHWLPQLEDVLAFHSAQKQHGGGGATYIMLRKSERKRQENLEIHQRRR